MIAKIVTHGPDREAALALLRQALAETQVRAPPAAVLGLPAGCGDCCANWSLQCSTHHNTRSWHIPPVSAVLMWQSQSSTPVTKVRFACGTETVLFIPNTLAPLL